MVEFRELADIETGEIITSYEIIDEFILDKQKAKERQRKGHEIRKSKDTFNTYIDSNLGSFYFQKYSELLKMVQLENGKYDVALLFRFSYICTFVNFDCILIRDDVKKNSEKSFMDSTYLKGKLNINRTQANQTFDRLKELKLIKINEDGYIQINDKYCKKGEFPGKKGIEVSRVFDEGIRNLYENAKPREHKLLGLLIPLLPYLNIQNNIICRNICEEVAEEIDTLTIQDICRVVGYSIAQAKRLERELLKITVSDEYCLIMTTKDATSFFTVNPKLFYRGSDLSSLKRIIDLFHIKK